MEFISRSIEETQQFGQRLGQQLSAGDVVGLLGELGTGKTTLIQGIAKGLEIDPGVVKSPTFILLREYAGRVPLIHVDGYRLEHPSSAMWLDVEWLFAPSKATVIEWADRLAECLPEDYLEVRLAHRSANQRTITMVGHGPRSQQLIEELRRGVHRPQSTVHREPDG